VHCIRVKGTTLIRNGCLILLSLFLATSSFAEDNSSRRNEQQGAAKETEKQNKEHFQPAMMGKFLEAAKHFEEAQKARQDKNEGKAKQEEEMGKMKQMEGQQLQKQIEANKKEADQNHAGAQTMVNPEQIKVPTIPGENKVISLRDPNYSSQPANSVFAPTPPPAEPPKPAIPTEQLATLSVSDKFIAGGLSPVKTEAAPVSNGPDQAAREKFGYDEAAKPSAASGTVSSGATATSSPATSMSGASPAVSLGSAPIVGGGSGGGGGASGGGGDFWKGMGGLVEDDNRQVASKEAKLNPLNLRGANGEKKGKDALPGAGLSDEAFWKKVGKVPAKCKASTEISKRQRTTCLRTARRDYEKKWKETQRRPASSSLQAKNGEGQEE